MNKKIKQVDTTTGEFAEVQISCHYNTVRRVSDHERYTKPSLTVPDQSFTIAEIIARSERGLPITGVKVAVYDPEDGTPIPDLRKMDLVDVYELKKKLDSIIEKGKRELQQQQQEQQQKETEEYYKKKFSVTHKIEDIQDTADPKTPPKKGGDDRPRNPKP